MNRRQFLSISATFTGGTLMIPNFLYALKNQPFVNSNSECLIFIQLDGGNDGLNTFIPYDNPLYKALRPNIGFAKDEVINKSNGMGFHPILKGISNIQQNGDLSIIQNVGYPEPNRSHFRSQEIWQTASSSHEYLTRGWLGRYLDLQCNEHIPTAGINLDTIDNLSLKGEEPNFITVKNLNHFKKRENENEFIKLSGNPQLDFARKISYSVSEGSKEIQKALKYSKTEITYPKSQLSSKLEWIARLIKGNLNSKVYYTSLNGFDTHNNQLGLQKHKLKELDEALATFYQDLKDSKLLEQATIVIFSEFGRRVKDNGSGTDHGTAAPMIIIGGQNKGIVYGDNPDLKNLDNGDLIYKTDFRSVYATLLNEKMKFNPIDIGLNNNLLKGLF
ncbi:Uncharacterized conserved protein, DUF1501 family [Flaviramulus basaltis]|uniref:Uncharacterized conserved protein, DUF1501 family n=1 Tax=Flaviramulus basaltis TaxID=369401 RepID=A0A1K2IM71_9FLAO|nr:DUF1501 domain-containing protein [Flaviramulus basaltis]SFZ93565.1 Uncharacterized conserved protein, DUF1501 family [Flaviramulus basaltis]